MVVTPGETIAQQPTKLKTIFTLFRELFGSLLPFWWWKGFFLNPKGKFGLAYILHIPKKIFTKTQKLAPEAVFEKGDVLLLLDASWNFDIKPALIMAKREDIKVVAFIYDVIPLTHPHFFDTSLVYSFEKWFVELSSYADGYIAISESVKKDLIGCYKKYKNDNGSKSVFFDSIKLGSDFINKEFDEKNISNDIKNIFYTNKNVYIVVSTIEPRKNHSFILDAFDKLWKDDMDVCLLIIGKIGWKVESLLGRIKNHQEFGKRLYMQGNISDEELAFCYTNAKGCIFASFIEGFGLPIIEGLYFGKTVLASDTLVHREVGGNNIKYFGLDDYSNLVDLLKVANTEIVITKINEKTKLTSWNESARELLNKLDIGLNK
jgi:alpha-1,2-rhamnosyltransferase